MSESKYPRTYYGYQSGITGFCYLVWHSEANDCDVPAPEGDYVRESDYAELRKERDALCKENKTTIWIVDWFENMCPAQLEEAREYASRMLWRDKS